mmetsp:Transcript_10985/g.24591  ORF Transcript_10985/g.24591 Transcript_10985/m.24591 type:complete len:483 (+) Transcript_10985:63-1511(+)
MGKKLQGAKLRAKQRQKAQLEEVQERQAELVAQQRSVDKTNDQLFVLDTVGNAVPRAERSQKEPKSNTKKKKTTTWSAAEQAAIDKLTKQHTAEQLAAMATQGRRVLDYRSNRLRTHGIRKTKEKKGAKMDDLWGEEEEDKNNKETTKKTTITKKTKQTEKTKRTEKTKQTDDEPTTKTTNKPAGGTARPLVGDDAATATAPISAIPSRTVKVKGVAVDTPRAGQSYRPDPLQHQKVLQDAVMVEDRRNQALKQKKAPISPGMKPETKALILGDSDTDSDDDEEEENDNEPMDDTSLFHKQKDKLTRAQRNKQKRVRQQEKERLEAKKKRKLENLVHEIPRFKKEIRRQVETQNQRQATKEERAAQLLAAKEQAGTNVEHALSQQDPLRAPPVPVALSFELGTTSNSSDGNNNKNRGSLRTIVPKGNLVTDRMASFALRNLAPRLPAQAAAHKEAMKKKRRRSKIKVKGAKQWQGEDFVIIK